MAHIAESRLTSTSSAGGNRGGKVMLITPDRIVYVGLLGRPHTREFGALTVYVSLGTPFQFRIDGGDWESAEMRVVAPDTPHQIATNDRLIGMIMIEPESVDLARLPHCLQLVPYTDNCSFFASQLRHSFSSLLAGEVDADSIRTDVDQFFFDQTLTTRTLEPRMAAVVERIAQHPCDSCGAEYCARLVDLSFSRFLHLFKEDVGTTFRRFRAWKRARSFLTYVNSELNLTDIALEIGYPDSSHFSHTVRHYWGLTPKDIVAGSRQLAVISEGGFTSAPY